MTEFDKKVKEWALMVENNSLGLNPVDEEIYEDEDPELAKHLKKQSHILTMIYRKYLRRLLREFQSENLDISFTFDLYDSDPIRFPVISSTRVCVDGKVTQELINAIEGIARTLENTRCEDIFDEIATFVDGGGIEYDTSTNELIQDWREITEKHQETNQEFILKPGNTDFCVLLSHINPEKFNDESECRIFIMSNDNSLEPRLKRLKSFIRPVSWIKDIPTTFNLNGGTKPEVVFQFIVDWIKKNIPVRKFSPLGNLDLQAVYPDEPTT